MSAKQRIPLFVAQLCIPHLCNFLRAKTPTSPNGPPLGSKINLDRFRLRILRQRRKNSIRISSPKYLHGLAIINPGRNAAKVIAQISDVDRIHDRKKYHIRIALQSFFLKNLLSKRERRGTPRLVFAQRVKRGLRWLAALIVTLRRQPDGCA